MGRAALVNDMVEFNDDGTVTIRGIGAPKRVALPPEVRDWLMNGRGIARAIEEVANNYRFRRRLPNAGAIKSLLLLLYSIHIGEPPYKTARRFGTHPEHLYRLRRGLIRDGLMERVRSILSQHNQYISPKGGERNGAERRGSSVR